MLPSGSYGIARDHGGPFAKVQRGAVLADAGPAQHKLFYGIIPTDHDRASGDDGENHADDAGEGATGTTFQQFPRDETDHQALQPFDHERVRRELLVAS